MGFNGSVSRVTRGVGLRPVPPHPSPLPWGEGTALARRASSEHHRFVERLGRILPLPTGI